MPKVWLGLGSNSGDSLDILRGARKRLCATLSTCAFSSIWRSRARYYERQPDFYNMAASGVSDLSPRALLEEIHLIEKDFGRDRNKEIFKGPRTLDIDILLYDNKIVTEPDLIIPHPGLAERKFALLPLLELDFGLTHPGLGIALKELAASLPPQGIYPLKDYRYDEFYPE